jgi:hypothetical protein
VSAAAAAAAAAPPRAAAAAGAQRALMSLTHPTAAATACCCFSTQMPEDSEASLLIYDAVVKTTRSMYDRPILYLYNDDFKYVPPHTYIDDLFTLHTTHPATHHKNSQPTKNMYPAPI